MSRPKTRNSELIGPFLIQIKRYFSHASLLQAKHELGFSHWSDNKWYKAVDGGPLTSEDAYDIEQAFIQWIRKNANGSPEDLKMANMLAESASPDRNKDPH